MEECIGYEKSYPYDEAEETNNINNGQAADAFFFQLSEVGNHTDTEECEQEEYSAESVDGTGDASPQRMHISRGKAQDKENKKRPEIAEDETGKTVQDV